uniref:cAMP regulated phosphoprotein 19 n=1 Tax=Macrostomum lignano TaxID=282301 RepID=A0A1I8GJY7_9PLAT
AWTLTESLEQQVDIRPLTLIRPSDLLRRRRLQLAGHIICAESGRRALDCLLADAGAPDLAGGVAFIRDLALKRALKQVMSTTPGQSNSVSIEQTEEAKLKQKYPNLNRKSIGSSVLHKRLNNKGQKYFDSGDYNMAKAKQQKIAEQQLKEPVRLFEEKHRGAADALLLLFSLLFPPLTSLCNHPPLLLRDAVPHCRNFVFESSSETERLSLSHSDVEEPSVEAATTAGAAAASTGAASASESPMEPPLSKLAACGTPLSRTPSAMSTRPVRSSGMPLSPKHCSMVLMRDTFRSLVAKVKN